MFKWNRDKCLRCGGCVSICPKNALELTEQGIIRDEKNALIAESVRNSAQSEQ